MKRPLKINCRTDIEIHFEYPERLERYIDYLEAKIRAFADIPIASAVEDDNIGQTVVPLTSNVKTEITIEKLESLVFTPPIKKEDKAYKNKYAQRHARRSKW